MFDEKLVKDGALSFNAPVKGSVKPNVVYYDPNVDGTGVEYSKDTEKTPKQKTTLFKAVVTMASLFSLVAVVSIVYFFVVKLRSKPVEEPKKEVIYEEGSLEERVVDKEQEEKTEPQSENENESYIHKYFKSLVFGK